MKRRDGLRRGAKWVGIVGCVLVGLSAIVQTRWSVRCYFSPRVGVVLAAGATILDVNSGTSRSGLTVRHAYKTWGEAGRAWKNGGLLPQWAHSGNGEHIIYIPLWIWMAVFTAIAVLLRDRRGPAPGHCPCGYDMTGNEGGTCPECGRIDGKCVVPTGEGVITKIQRIGRERR